MKQAFAFFVPLLTLSSVGHGAGPYIAPQPVVGGAVMAAPLSSRILALHNAERERLGEEPLAWDEGLAREAQGWAQALAASGRFEHSPPNMRRGQGENLFIGTSGIYKVDAMIGYFLAERADFKPGRFPDVAAHGSWQDVGHYTQIIWRKTQRLGCAIAKTRRDEILLCRYFPAGNIFGQKVP